MYQNVIDCHYHLSLTRTFSHVENVQEVLDVLQKCQLESICVQNIVLWFPRNLTRNPLALLAKLADKKVYSFGGVRYPSPDAPNKHFNYLEQVKELYDLGFDGVKLFGKPNIRQRFGEPFDSEVFDDMFTWLEETQFPVLYHIGDPIEFWDAEKAPPFAKDNGWIYSTPSFDQYYEEIDRLLSKHPNLRVLFPHFFFLSDDINRLRAFLKKWENVWIDITPGSEMYHNFTLQHKEAVDFFTEFQDRVLFGTDNTGNTPGHDDDPPALALDRIHTMCDFLSTDHAYGWNEDFTGLHLPATIVDKIKRLNFYRFIQASSPKNVNISLAKSYTDKLQHIASEFHDSTLDTEFCRIIELFSAL